MAYMGLMQQYHKKFSKANGDNPVQQAIDALKSHGDRVDDFMMNFRSIRIWRTCNEITEHEMVF